MNATDKFDEAPSPGIQLPDLAGGVALVTGASAGIGRATVEALLANGATVHGVAHDESTITHAQYRHHRCDLRDANAIRQLSQAVASQTDRLDYVVNVAGVDPKVALAEGGAEHWDEIADLNLRGYYLVLHELLPLLRTGRGRSIVNVSSINYRLGVPKRAIYSATKAGILGLTTGLARELGAEGIRLNTVSPGWVFTERQVRDYFSGADAEKNLAYLASVQSLPLKIDAADIANHILFYLSAVSRASTGHNCVVDAGWTLE